MIDYKMILTELNKFGITNKLEQACFLGQCAHESADFKSFSEGSKFRFGRAKIIYPKYKTAIQAKQDELSAKDDEFCPQPWLFDTVYGTRMGNQDNGTQDDDGYDFRGAGLLQLTGKDMYLRCLNYLTGKGIKRGLDMSNIRDYVCSEEGAIVSAIWVWFDKGLGALARAGNIKEVTGRINGGQNGDLDRIAKINYYKKLLGV